MAFRRGAGYGQSYGAYGSDQVDPLAAAIMGALGAGTQMFEHVRGVRQENADRREAAAARAKAEERQAAQDAQEQARWDYGVKRDEQSRTDALDRETRQRDAARGDRLTARGISAIPTGFGGTTYAKVADSEQEAELKTRASLEDATKTALLRQQAKALGIPNAETMTRGELEVLTDERVGQRKDDASFADFQRRENYQEGLFRGRPVRGVGVGSDGQPLGKALPATMADNLGSYNALIGTAVSAREKLDAATAAGKNVTGPIRGRVTGQLGQFLGMGLDAGEVSARAALANVTSSIMKDRSGGAITPQEFVRLEPFLPNANKPEGVARQNLIDLTAELERIKDERLNALEGSGYDVRAVRGGQSPAKADDADAWAAQYLAGRRKKP